MPLPYLANAFGGDAKPFYNFSTWIWTNSRLPYSIMIVPSRFSREKAIRHVKLEKKGVSPLL